MAGGLSTFAADSPSTSLGTGAYAARPDEIEAWLERAAVGDSFVYARCHSWSMDRELRLFVAALHDDGEVTPVQRRVKSPTSGQTPLTEYLIQRRGEGGRPRARLAVPAAEPPAVPPRIEEMGEEAGRLMIVVKWLAAMKQACPSDAKLAELADLRDRKQASYQLTRLRDAGLIAIENVWGGARGGPRGDVRVITVTATGRSTLRPGSGQALRPAQKGGGMSVPPPARDDRRFG